MCLDFHANMHGLTHSSQFACTPQALRAHEQRLHKSILQRAQGASEAERSFSSAESVGRELARKTEELNARVGVLCVR